jgi:hypothetical protein
VAAAVAAVDHQFRLYQVYQEVAVVVAAAAEGAGYPLRGYRTLQAVKGEGVEGAEGHPIQPPVASWRMSQGWG